MTLPIEQEPRSRTRTGRVGSAVARAASATVAIAVTAAVAVAVARALRRPDLPPGGFGGELEPAWWPEFERKLEAWKRDASGAS